MLHTQYLKWIFLFSYQLVEESGMYSWLTFKSGQVKVHTHTLTIWPLFCHVY